MIIKKNAKNIKSDANKTIKVTINSSDAGASKIPSQKGTKGDFVDQIELKKFNKDTRPQLGGNISL